MKFYKLKNGNISFEYEIKNKLSHIEDLLYKRENDLLCGVFSAVMAECLTACMKNRSIYFIPILIVLFYISKLIVKMFSFLRMLQNNHRKLGQISDEEELQIQELFWDKIVPEIVYGVSLVNRVEYLELNKNKDKECLKKIYTLQAKRSFWVASEMLNNSIYSLSEQKREDYINVIGSDALKWIKETSIEYLEKIEKMDKVIDILDLKRYYFKMQI